ncbi:hypothetical protein PENTCL1PPCAC_4371, partial [Pristionchus entomophagus]
AMADHNANASNAEGDRNPPRERWTMDPKGMTDMMSLLVADETPLFRDTINAAFVEPARALLVDGDRRAFGHSIDTSYETLERNFPDMMRNPRDATAYLFASLFTAYADTIDELKTQQEIRAEADNEPEEIVLDDDDDEEEQRENRDTSMEAPGGRQREQPVAVHEVREQMEEEGDSDVEVIEDEEVEEEEEEQMKQHFVPEMAGEELVISIDDDEHHHQQEEEEDQEVIAIEAELQQMMEDFEGEGNGNLEPAPIRGLIDVSTPSPQAPRSRTLSLG